MNWFKKIWEDTGSLSSRELFFKYLLPMISILFTWFFIGKLYLSQIEPNSLVANKGEVLNLKIISEEVHNEWSKSHLTHIEYPLKITLRHFNYYFRLRGIFMDDFVKVAKQIPKGDSITIYTLSNFQGNICNSSISDIYQIDKKGKTVFPIDGMHHYNLEKSIFPGIVSILSILLYYYYKRGKVS